MERKRLGMAMSKLHSNRKKLVRSRGSDILRGFIARIGRIKGVFVFLLVGLLLFFNLFDALATVYAVMHLNAYELNPLMRILLNIDPAVFLIIKLGYGGMIGGIVWQARSKPVVISTLIGVTLAYACLFVYWLVYLHSATSI